MLETLPEGLFTCTDSGVEFSIYLVPGAKQRKILGIIETDKEKMLKFAINERPIENKANIALIKFLATMFKVPKSNISIRHGHKSRKKRIEVKGIKLTNKGA